MGERSGHANEVSVAGGTTGIGSGRFSGDERGMSFGDAHTTWLVLLIKDGRGPAGNYPLISNSPTLYYVCVYVCVCGVYERIYTHIYKHTYVLLCECLCARENAN